MIGPTPRTNRLVGPRRRPAAAHLLPLFALIPILGLAMPAGPAMAADDAPQVLVTILPHAGLVERLAGDAVRVRVLVGRNQSPETYQPSPRELQRLAGTRIWYTTGTPVEATLRSRILSMLPGLTIVPTHADLEIIEGHLCTGHDHDHVHDHGEMDPHVWVSARNTARQAAVMARSLQELLPGRAERIAVALQELQDELAALDAELGEVLAPVAGRTFYVFHPAFGYFARDYGLRQEAVESGGQAPSPRGLAELMRSMRDQGARTIFVQPQQSVQAARPIAVEAGLDIVVLDPLAPDHLANLHRIGLALRDALAARP